MNPPPLGSLLSVPRSVFLFDPSALDRGTLQDALGAVYSMQHFTQESALILACAKSPRPDLTIVSWDSIKRSTSVLSNVVAANTLAPVLLLCDSRDVEVAAVASGIGVKGILQMPMSRTDLLKAVAGYLPQFSFEAQTDPRLLDDITLPDGTLFVCRNKQMQAIKRQATLVATSDIPVLILGESGTGKDVLAKYLHAMSGRSGKMFLKVNCAALRGNLLESEFFGHERGAFSGAFASAQGKFEMCEGGTIFLDEIGEMSATLQAKLLHVLQDGSYARLGGGAPLKTNVRVIAATNINIKAAIAARTFREDLYYRLTGFTMTVPPLRERQDEIPVFAQRFMQKAAARHKCAPLEFSDAMISALQRHRCPGNLRELENIINRLVVLRDERTIIADLENTGVHGSEGHTARGISGDGSLRLQLQRLRRAAESAAIAKALEETCWNRKAASRKMKISYTSLLHKIKFYGLAAAAPSKAQTIKHPVHGQPAGLNLHPAGGRQGHTSEPKPPEGTHSISHRGLARVASDK